MSEPTIRPAEAADVPALADLARRTWADAFGASVSEDERDAELEATRSESYFREALERRNVLVAEAGGRLVGYAELGDVDIPEVEPAPGDGQLHRVYVETALQGRGLGGLLTLAALEHPRLVGAGRVYLQVWEANERAVRLYESLGFRVAGTTRFTIGSGEPVEDLVMVLQR
jgi:ribosomal protein S18 acetylase RimI-like enzyme